VDREIRIYRAAWTLDLKVAIMFQQNRDGLQQIWTCDIHKSRILAYFDKRDEQEVIVLDVSEMGLVPVTAVIS
jgi:hypothetical protein